MPDASKNFSEMTNEEIFTELEKVEMLDLAIRRTKSQLRIHYQCPGLILWANNGRSLRGDEALKYLEEKLKSLIRAKEG